MTSIRNASSNNASKFVTMRVLLVDDHPHIRSIITGILHALGVVQVTTAQRGDVALNLLRDEHFDLLITDYEMPGMTGVELARLIRQDARSAAPKINFKIPILMITGNVTRDRLNEARDAGIDEMLAKPFTVLAVADRLNSVINKRREFVVCEAFLGPCRRRASKVEYAGPKRRDTDLGELPTFEIEQERILVHQEARTLCRLAQLGDIVDAGVQESALATAHSAAARSKRIRDPLLERACLSLAAYIQCVAKGQPIESKLVETHGQAILELLELGTRDPRTSAQVTQGLEDLVAKRTSRKRAA